MSTIIYSEVIDPCFNLQPSYNRIMSNLAAVSYRQKPQLEYY